MKKAVAYARFSTDRQREESIEAQIDAIALYCKQNSISLGNIYADRAQSGTSDNRTAFQKMMTDASKHTFDYIIVHKLDRFSRDRYNSAINKKKLKDCGVTVLSVLEKLDDSPESVILESVLEGMAEYYSKNLAREVKKGLYKNVEKGKCNGGPTPYGYNVNLKTRLYEINEFEAITVRKIFDLYLDNYGYIAIAQYLTENGFIHRNGSNFKSDTICKILKNEKYAGFYTYGKLDIKKVKGKRVTKKATEYMSVEGGIPAIINRKTWDDVQYKIKHFGPKPRVKVPERYLLVGYAKCEKCGSNYIGSSSTNNKTGCKNYRYRFYTCSKHNRKKCDAKIISADLLETIVIDKIEEFYFNDEFLDLHIDKLNYSLSNTKSIDNELAIYNEKLISLKKKKEKLLDVYIDSIISKEEYTLKSNAIHDEYCLISTKIANISDIQQFDKKEIRKALMKIMKQNKNEKEYKKLLIKTFLDRIDISDDCVKIYFKYGVLEQFGANLYNIANTSPYSSKKAFT